LVYLSTESPNSALAQAVFDKDREWHAPSLWQSEYRNAVLGLIRNGIVLEADALAAFEQARLVVGARESQAATADVLSHARGNRVTAYDLEFVVLASSLSAPLVTFDREILAAFPTIAMHPRDFLAS
jgi:predicted nucleic acid-binding protein